MVGIHIEELTRNKKNMGKCVKQRIRPKIDFVSIRQAMRRANKTDEPMFLCVLKATDCPGNVQKKRKTKAGAVHSMTEGEKRRISKETGPIKKDIPADEVIKMKVEEADPMIREQL